jgi:hypothetical protein
MVTGTIQLTPIMQSPCRTEVKVLKRIPSHRVSPKSAKTEHMVTRNASTAGTRREPIPTENLFPS